jgi:hypothetical protein
VGQKPKEANALDDDVDFSHLLAGHGAHLFPYGDLHFVGGFADFRTVGNHDSYLDIIMIFGIFCDFYSAMIGFAFGEELADAIHDSSANAGDAGYTQGSQPDDTGYDGVIDFNLTERGGVVG